MINLSNIQKFGESSFRIIRYAARISKLWYHLKRKVKRFIFHEVVEWVLVELVAQLRSYSILPFLIDYSFPFRILFIGKDACLFQSFFEQELNLILTKNRFEHSNDFVSSVLDEIEIKSKDSSAELGRRYLNVFHGGKQFVIAFRLPSTLPFRLLRGCFIINDFFELIDHWHLIRIANDLRRVQSFYGFETIVILIGWSRTHDNVWNGIWIADWNIFLIKDWLGLVKDVEFLWLWWKIFFLIMPYSVEFFKEIMWVIE